MRQCTWSSGAGGRWFCGSTGSQRRYDRRGTDFLVMRGLWVVVVVWGLWWWCGVCGCGGGGGWWWWLVWGASYSRNLEVVLKFLIKYSNGRSEEVERLSKRSPKGVQKGSKINVSGPGGAHCSARCPYPSRSLTTHPPTHPPPSCKCPHAPCCALNAVSAALSRMLTGACNPMLCPVVRS